MSATALLQRAARSITHKTRGQTHGMIIRLMNPGDLACQLLKPFVFLDLFYNGRRPLTSFGLHPHSGIATLTYMVQGNVRYEDTNGATGLVPEGGIEWVRAGKGVWHGAGAGEPGRARGFQLWVALPPHLELGPSISMYLAPADIPVIGPARVLLGSYAGVASAIEPPSPMTYLAVTLRAGERWVYDPPIGHQVLWAAVARGSVAAPHLIEAGELALFERGSGSVEFCAVEDAQFVLGSAAPHNHPLVVGHYSVHTSAAALQAGEARIREIRAELQRDGRL
jgi:redox-sensitive bicupin YhaK (pirin superfamily)